MHSIENKYHITLAKYFLSKPLYLDEKNKEKPNVRKLVEQPWQQTKAEMWADLEQTLCDLRFIEAKVETGMVFDLTNDFTEALKSVPIDYSQLTILRLLGEALRTDLHFIARHQSTLFQCFWNRCWWHDCSDATKHYDSPKLGWPVGSTPCDRPEPKLSTLMETWRAAKERAVPDFTWLRSLRPPPDPLGTGQHAVYRGLTTRVDSVCFSPDGARIAAGGFSFLAKDNPILIWNVNSGEQLIHIPGAGGSRIAFSLDGTRIVSESVNSIWDVRSGEKIAHFTGDQFLFCPDGRRILSWMKDGTVRLLDADTGDELASLKGYTQEPKCVAVSQDLSRVVCCYQDKTIQVLNIETCSEVQQFHAAEIMAENILSMLSFLSTKDGERVVIAYSTGDVIHICDLETGKELSTLTGVVGESTCIVFSPNGTLIASGTDDGTVNVWATDGGPPLACFRGHEDRVTQVAFSPDETRIASASFDHTVRVWSVDESGNSAASKLRGHDKKVKCIAISNDGKLVVSGAGDMTVRIWDAVTGAELVCLHEPDRWVESVAFSPVTERVASGSALGMIRIWDINSGKMLNSIEAHPGEGVTSLHYSLFGDQIISKSKSGNCFVWDAETGESKGILGLKRSLDISGAEKDLQHEVDLEKLETEIRSPETKKTLGWLPVRLAHLTSDPTHQTWAGASNHNLYIFRLEGLQASIIKSENINKHEIHILNQALELVESDDFISLAKLLNDQEKLYRESGIDDTLYYFLSKVTKVYTHSGLITPAMNFLKTAEEVYRQAGSKHGLQGALSIQAGILNYFGHPYEALSLFKEQEKLCSALDDKDTLQECLGDQAEILKEQGDLDRALTLFSKKAQLCRELGNMSGLQNTLGNQAVILKAKGDLNGALVLLKEMENVCHDSEDKHALQACLGIQATTLYIQGKESQAEALFKDQQHICRAMEDPDALAISLANQALILARDYNRPGPALTLAEEAYDLAVEYKLSTRAQHTKSVLDFVRDRLHDGNRNMPEFKSQEVRWLERLFGKKPKSSTET